MPWYIPGDFFYPKSEADLDIETNRLISYNAQALDSGHIRGLIINENDDLYFKRLWRKFLIFWIGPVNLAIAAVLALALLATWRGLMEYSVYAAVALVLSFLLSSTLLYRQHRLVRYSLTRLEKYDIALRKTKTSQTVKGDEGALLAEHKRYRDELPAVVATLRKEADRYRRWHNFFQGIIIIGSVATSAITTASVSYEQARWIAVGVSAVVGLSAGFTGYFKYRERSFNLQQTADSIEREYESVELRVGRYFNYKSEADAYKEFANFVENIRDEQSKRQQQLDQPTEAKREQASGR
jgi:Protein of unknown function (DUF4231)